MKTAQPQSSTLVPCTSHPDASSRTTPQPARGQITADEREAHERLIAALKAEQEANQRVLALLNRHARKLRPRSEVRRLP